MPVLGVKVQFDNAHNQALSEIIFLGTGG